MHHPTPPRYTRALTARARTLLAGAAVGALTCGVLAVPLGAAHAADPVLLSQGRTATASSSENADYYKASYAVDGDGGTRWSSAAQDGQWLQIDLGATAALSRVELDWEGAYADGYKIQVSADGSAWTDAYATTSADGGKDTDAVSGSGRYVRVLSTHRATGYGISLYEVRVYGTAGASTDPGGGSGGGSSGTCDTNAALGRPATASSTENGGTPASNAVDGKADTRWSSAASDPQWLQVDLGSTQHVCGVELDWEAAYGKAFQVQTSTDGSAWTTVYQTTSGTGGMQKLTVDGSGRYVRVLGSARGTGYGYSLWELKVLTGSGSTTTPPTGGTVQPADPANPDFGPNVHVFKPTDDKAAVQNTVNDVFSRQETNQFGTERDQLLFLPGSYDLQANIGFYTSISGAGLNPDDVQINGGVWVDAQWFGGNATQNFWRSAENFAVTPSTGQARWAVAQAAPMRRVHVKGALALDSSAYGWASGGYIADSKVDGKVTSYTQQQWYMRDSSVGSWDGALWNQVFSGDQGVPATSFPKPAVTTLPTTGAVREKPYLYWKDGKWAVFVPSLRSGTTGTTWPNTPGSSLSLSTFYLAHASDSAATINAALAQGLNVLFAPGVYHLDQTLTVTRPDTVLLGLGMATIIPENGVVGLKTVDVSGIKVAGLLFDQGTTKSHAVIELGDAGKHTDHAVDPQSLQDVFVRVGGVVAGKTDNGIIVNADDTIIDHIWSWRADHGAGAGWTSNTADYGLVVNGDDVNAYGLFVEHYQKYNVLWNGQRGRTIFFQNELPYDPPSAAAWSHDGEVGYAAYKVSDGVTQHDAWGLGSYCVFTTDPSIEVTNGFEVPNAAGVKLHSISTVSLGGQGSYAHVINGTGPRAAGTDTVPATVTSYGG